MKWINKSKDIVFQRRIPRIVRNCGMIMFLVIRVEKFSDRMSEISLQWEEETSWMHYNGGILKFLRNQQLTICNLLCDRYCVQSSYITFYGYIVYYVTIIGSNSNTSMKQQ